MRYIKCVDCDHKYCEFCNAGDKYQKKAKANVVTNFDRIKAMSVEKMAKFLVNLKVNGHYHCNYDRCVKYSEDCEFCITEWLESEVSEE